MSAQVMEYTQTAPSTTASDGITLDISLRVLGLSSVYAASLGMLERRFPIKPDHIWAEVAGGVLLSLVPVALEARRSPKLDWKAYEGAVWSSFIAAGVPIILWQIGETLIRHQALLRYTTSRLQQIDTPYGYSTTSLATQGGSRTREGDPINPGDDWGAATGPGDA